MEDDKMCLCLDDQKGFVEQEPSPETLIIGTARRIWPKTGVWTSEELTRRSGVVWKLVASTRPGFSKEFVTATLCLEFGPNPKE
ncbi:MAG: hypothetical protein HZA95_04030 [Candidatus Vogelbacteria bacterium]|nr:hypothetical protein [Candidatus Vogelbacteria bacterium]